MNKAGKRLRVGVIVDRMTLARWQADALRTLAGEADLLVYSCENGKAGPRRLRHALYYLLNIFTIRNPLTRRSSWPADLPAQSVSRFDAEQDGVWQILPEKLIGEMCSQQPDVIVKFGMGLLRVPAEEGLPVPILSYHHGDPARFRGRPAGFYETLAGEAMIGQVVQRLSNRLDAGDILACAQSKVEAHSYRSTLIGAYRQSSLILKQAIANSLEGKSWTPPQWGPNYRLPSNGSVVKFLLRQWGKAAARLAYGLTKEKRWMVATVQLDMPSSLDQLAETLSDRANWQIAPLPPGYRFLADPFFHPDGGLLVEGLSSRTDRGEILHVDRGVARRLSGKGGHFSYPATCSDGDQWRIVPEISEWSSAKVLSLAEGGLGSPVELAILGSPRLLDPTPFMHQGNVYLFANRAEDGPSVLRLWVAQSLDSQWREHPSSPIRLSPHGSRMAGSIFRIGGQLIRVGQDLRRSYGDGLSFFRITQFDPQNYAEEWARDFRFQHCKGPHTLNLSDGRVAFDFYSEQMSPLAGFRRFKERRAARRAD